MKLSDAYSAARLEQACKRALSFTERPSFKSIQIILKSGQDNLHNEEPVSSLPETPGSRFAHGGEYYRRKEET